MKKLLFFVAMAVSNILLAQLTPTVVKDINPGYGDGCTTDYHLSELNGKAYFFAMESSFDPALYVSDGSSAGTSVLRGFGHSTSSDEESFFKFNNMLFWTGYDSANYGFDVQILRTDGTAAGTFPLKLFYASSSAFYQGGHFLNNSNTVFFIASDSSYSHIWRTDGSIAGTYKLFTYSLSSDRELYRVVNDKLVFNNGTKIYVSDGTVAGTQEIYSPPTYMIPSAGIVMGSNVYFGYEGAFWKTNGTTVGTVPLIGDYAGNAMVLGNKLFYPIDDGVNGNELWITDGTVNGTHMVKDIYPGQNGPYPAIIGKTATQVIFKANDGINGTELWASDGTSGGTFMLKNICPGSSFSVIGAPVTDEVNHIVYFLSDNCVQSEQLYRTDGTPSGTYQVNNLAVGTLGFSAPKVIDDLVYYSCVSTGIGLEMFVTNGQPGGTISYDINPGSGWSYSFLFTKAGSKVFFKATTPATGQELWSLSPPVLSGIEEAGNEGTYLNLFPNPAGPYLQVNLPDQEIEAIHIYNMSGQLMLETTGIKNINVGSLTSGIYIAEVNTGNDIVRKRFVKL